MKEVAPAPGTQPPYRVAIARAPEGPDQGRDCLLLDLPRTGRVSVSGPGGRSCWAAVIFIGEDQRARVHSTKGKSQTMG